MNEIVNFATKCMYTTTSAHIYSSPHFALEVALMLIVCIIYILLHLEISNTAVRTLILKPNAVYLSNRIKATFSNDSNCTSITCVQHQVCALGITDSKHTEFRDCIRRNQKIELGSPLRIGDCMNTVEKKIENMLSLTPDEYVQKDIISKLTQSDFGFCLKSLTTLFETCVNGKKSETTIKRQIQMAKEELQNASIATDTNRYFGRNAIALTSSLFDLLEGIILSSSLEHPLPFKGDLTTFIFDVGNLNINSDRVLAPKKTVKFTESEEIDTSLASEGSTSAS